MSLVTLRRTAGDTEVYRSPGGRYTVTHLDRGRWHVEDANTGRTVEAGSLDECHVWIDAAHTMSPADPGWVRGDAFRERIKADGKPAILYYDLGEYSLVRWVGAPDVQKIESDRIERRPS